MGRMGSAVYLGAMLIYLLVTIYVLVCLLLLIVVLLQQGRGRYRQRVRRRRQQPDRLRARQGATVLTRRRPCSAPCSSSPLCSYP